jgi:ribosomal protein S6--L-glutamate ligase
MAEKDNGDKFVVGCEEWCVLPSLGIPAIKARVDSGAKTSSLHAFNMQAFKRGGQAWVSFEVHPLQNNRRVVVRCEAPIADRRMVKSSSGVSEKRYVIQVPVDIGDHSCAVEITLANRDSMGYRMLLGREAMVGRMLVDPALHFCRGDFSPGELERVYGHAESVRSGLKIGLLATNPDLYSNRRIMEAADERGHEIVFLNIEHCYMKLDAEAPEIHYRGGLILNDLDAVIPRIRPSMTFYGCALTRHFESLGTYTLNSSAAISQSSDKLFALQLLLRHGLDIPTTGFAKSPIDTRDLIDMVGGAPLVVRLLEGAQGRGVVLAETRKAAESVVSAIKSLRANLLVQEFVRDTQGKGVRCLVVDGKVVATIERGSMPGELSPNGNQNGNAAVVKPRPDEKRLAVQAAKTLGLKVAGVDLIRSSRGPLLLEVHPTPGLEAAETATGRDIAGILIAAIERKLNWKRELAAQVGKGGETGDRIPASRSRRRGSSRA